MGIVALYILMSITPSVAVDIVKKPSMHISIGKTLYVGGIGEGNYSKIQDAIDDAKWRDTVFVYDENSPYYENLIVYKSINLIGEDKNTTVIDGRQKGNIVLILMNRVKISGFTLRNASIPNYYHAGINIRSNYNTITDNIILNSYSFGILMKNSHNNIISCNNIISSWIDGIHLFNSNRNTINDNRITSNKVNGIMLRPSRNNNIIRNTITNNSWGIQISSSGSQGFILKTLMASFNEIKENNFMENNINAKFHGSILNRWKGNYWDDHTNSEPYLIHGVQEIMIYSIGPHTPPFLHIEVPWIQFDRHPAKEPNDIGV